MEKRRFAEEFLQKVNEREEVNTQDIAFEVIDVLRKHNVTRREMKNVFKDVESLLDAFASI